MTDRRKRFTRWLILASTVLALLWAGRVGYLAYAVWSGIQTLARSQAARSTSGSQTSPNDASNIRVLADAVHSLREDMAALRSETWPFAQALRLAEGLPVVGPDLAAVAPLVDIACDVTFAADETLAVFLPAVEPPSSRSPLPVLLDAVQSGRERLIAAQAAARRALRNRATIPAGVSPALQRQVDRLDTYLPLLDEALTVSIALPDLLGADQARTYLLLAQNRDELRATGGFISSVGVVTVDQGAVTLKIENSYALDDFAHRPYPLPPQPLQTYMGAQLWLFRDANWAADFPGSARAAAGLYRLGQGRSVDGVIAFDQVALRYLLAALGPIELPDGSGAVSADNVLQFLQTQWTPERGDLSPDSRVYDGGFMKGLGQALMNRAMADPFSLDLGRLADAVQQSLDEKHVLIYIPHPAISPLVESRGWDGAIRTGDQDFLYVVDSNVGFNKVNAVLQRSIRYEVDLSDLARPEADLTVRYTLPGPQTPCQQVNPNYGTGGYTVETQGCYWNYLRVMAPAGAVLRDGTARPTPGEWLWNGQPDAGLVAQTSGEAGAVEFDQFFVVPSGGALETALSYTLPAAIVHDEGLSLTYCLRLQKQPGTQAEPVWLSISLPAGSQVISGELESGRVEGSTVMFEDLALETDRHVCVAFSKP